MLKIKLARFGKKNQPHYRIVIAEARGKRDGKYVEKLGHYAPTQMPKILQIDVKKFESWLKKGAQPTATVASLFKRFKSGQPFPPKKKRLSKKAKAKVANKKNNRKNRVKNRQYNKKNKAKKAAYAKSYSKAVKSGQHKAKVRKG